MVLLDPNCTMSGIRPATAVNLRGNGFGAIMWHVLGMPLLFPVCPAVIAQQTTGCPTPPQNHRRRLHMTSIVVIEGIGQVYANKLRTIGISTCEKSAGTGC